MKTPGFRTAGAALVAAFIAATPTTVPAEVVTYPAPPEEARSPDFKVWADGRPVDVYVARTLDPPFAGKQWDYGGPYSFAGFDAAGAVTVRVESTRSLRSVVVRPESAGVRPSIADERSVTLVLDGPRQLSVEPDGKRGPLLLFANPLETDRPPAGAPGVVRFGPGVHTAGLVRVGSGQTLHLEGGAVVKGAVLAEGTNIAIRGRGILDGSDYEWRKGPYGHTLGIVGTNVTVEGITIRGSSHWTLVPRDSRDVTIRNVKICNGRVQNDDGINPCNSQRVLIADCFIRSDDDCVALKGLEDRGEDSHVEDITVERCILWCDRARIFLLGHESRAPFMRRVTLRDLDIIHFTMTAFLFEPGEEMRLEDVRVEDVRVHGEGQAELLRLKPVVNQYMRNKVPGHIRRVAFKSVTVGGAPGPCKVHLAGADAEHAVRDVTFEGVTIGGEPLTAGSARVSAGAHVHEVRFR